MENNKKNLSTFQQAIRAYKWSIFISILFYYPFSLLHDLIFQSVHIGEGLLLPTSKYIVQIITGSLFGYNFFLSLFVFCLVRDKKLKIWLIGAIFPLLMAWDIGANYPQWFLILSTIGWLLAKGILLIKNKK